MVDVDTNAPDIIKWIIKFLRGKMVVTKELLKSRKVSDIGSIPISSEEYLNQSNNLTHDCFEKIVFPEVLLTLQQEFKSWHDKLSHLHSKSILD